MKPEKVILLIDDDTDLREALVRQFKLQEDFRIEPSATAAEGIEKADLVRPDLIILDVDLPDMDGREACRLIRKHKVLAPILMLSEQATDSDVILGLDSGANDYIAKPIKFPVLLARVRAHIRTYEQSDDATFHLGPYEFRPSVKLLIDDGQRKIRLTDKETDILRYLYKARGRPVSCEELMAQIWGHDSQATTHTLETHMYRLRQKIEPNPGLSRFLITEGGGYSLQP
ncbi:MAG: response regulator transcription factor [Hyphomonadaceae bacterium]